MAVVATVTKCLVQEITLVKKEKKKECPADLYPGNDEVKNLTTDQAGGSPQSTEHFIGQRNTLLGSVTLYWAEDAGLWTQRDSKFSS